MYQKEFPGHDIGGEGEIIALDETSYEKDSYWPPFLYLFIYFQWKLNNN
jgi:hypothetical protein